MNKTVNRKDCLLAIDQGTTGSRAILYDAHGVMIAQAYQELTQRYPRPAWVEHNPEEIWKTVCLVVDRVLGHFGPGTRIHSLGITNQRETTILWNKKTGKPLCPAIVWQDRRTAAYCEHLKKRGVEERIRCKTGLVLDPYFSASKIRWVLDHIPKSRRMAERGEVLFGTVDSWILWRLTQGASHATDYTNASRTLLFNIHTKKWDPELLHLFGIPEAILPEVKPSASIFGKTSGPGWLSKAIPVNAILGDQQAALYGQSCYRPGEAKSTYGTGCFLMVNLGSSRKIPPFGLLQTLACDEHGRSVYALEGAVFMAGAAIQWLRDGLGLFKKASQTDQMIAKLKDNGGVTVVPAFTGLGAPYWKPEARGMISGLTRGSTGAHIVRAVLEAIAHQTMDVIEIMCKAAGKRVRSLKVDGGVTRNHFLMKFQADLLQRPVLISSISESTAWGVAKMAGRASGFWRRPGAIDKHCRYQWIKPSMARRQVEMLRKIWKKEVSRLLS